MVPNTKSQSRTRMSVEWRWFVICLIDCCDEGWQGGPNCNWVVLGREVRRDTWYHTHHTLLIPGPGHEQAQDNYLDHQHADSDHFGLRGNSVQRAIMGPNNSDLTNSFVEAFFSPYCLIIFAEQAEWKWTTKLRLSWRRLAIGSDWDWEAEARDVMRRKMSACQYCLSQREDQ